jgi:cytochrome c6
MVLGITATGKIVLLLTAGSFIGFSLIVSMIVPKRSPGFPGKNMPLFILVCLSLFAAQIGAVLWVTGTQETEAKAAEVPATTLPTTTPPPSTTAPATTAPATTTAPPTETSPPPPKGDPKAGKQVFLTAGCTGCHTLKDAGATGTVGPNLDDLKPPYDLVIDRVTHGKGVMPSFSDKLDAAQIEDVAAYVSSVAGT